MVCASDEDSGFISNANNPITALVNKTAVDVKEAMVKIVDVSISRHLKICSLTRIEDSAYVVILVVTTELNNDTQLKQHRKET